MTCLARDTLIWLCLTFLLTLPAFAQTPEPTTDFEAQIEQIESDYAVQEGVIAKGDADDATLVSARTRLEELQSQTAALKMQVEQRLTAIEQEVNGLGPVPEEGAPEESQIVQDRRAELAAQRSSLTLLTSQISALETKIQGSIDAIATLRRDIFAGSLIKRTPLDTGLLNSAISGAAAEVHVLTRLIQGWWRFTVMKQIGAVIFSTIAALIIALALAAFARISTRRAFQNVHEDPSYFAKLIRAFWRAVLPSLAFITFFAAAYGLYSYFGIFPSKIDQIVTAFFPVLTGIILVRNLAVAVFAPNEPEFRLLSMPDRSAWQMVYLTIALSAVNGLDVLIGRLNEVVSAPLSLTVAKSLIAALLIGILLLIIARVRGRTVEVDGKKESAHWPRWISVPVTVIGLGIIIAAFSGYIGLARFVSQQVVITGAILATMYIGILIGREVSKEGVLADTGAGQYLSDRFGLQSESLEQISVLLGLLTTILVFVLGLPLLLLQWGSQWEDVTFWASKLFFGFQVGNITLSLATVLIAIAVFILVYFFMQVFRRWLDKNVLERSRMDSGVRDSIKAGIGYVGLALALLFGVTTAGIDLSSLAIVAGALSLGIGFGLQNIVSNFVSGLILLIERPIKVGDWVVLDGGTQGTVKKISVRATEITTFQKQSIIVPNSELINSQVGNWTHKDKGGRVDISVGVAYGTNTREVERLLKEVAKARTDIMKFPEPFVIFLGFGDSSLDFELRFFIRDIGQIAFVGSEIRHEIAALFETHEIEIPFPQRDINIRTTPAEVDPLTLEDKSGEAEPQKT